MIDGVVVIPQKARALAIRIIVVLEFPGSNDIFCPAVLGSTLPTGGRTSVDVIAIRWQDRSVVFHVACFCWRTWRAAGALWKIINLNGRDWKIIYLNGRGRTIIYLNGRGRKIIYLNRRVRRASIFQLRERARGGYEWFLPRLRADDTGSVMRLAHKRLLAVLLAPPSDVTAGGPPRKDDEAERRSAAYGDADNGARR